MYISSTLILLFNIKCELSLAIQQWSSEVFSSHYWNIIWNYFMRNNFIIDSNYCYDEISSLILYIDLYTPQDNAFSSNWLVPYSWLQRQYTLSALEIPQSSMFLFSGKTFSYFSIFLWEIQQFPCDLYIITNILFTSGSWMLVNIPLSTFSRGIFTNTIQYPLINNI